MDTIDHTGMLSVNRSLFCPVRFNSGLLKSAQTMPINIRPGPVVTEAAPASDFRDAEEEHQDHLQKHPYGYSFPYVRPCWQLL